MSRLLLSLKEAQELLAGRSPAEFGIRPVAGRGQTSVYYLRAIVSRLDQIAGMNAPAGGVNDNDADGLGLLRGVLGVSGDA
jgi:hypothetical protein